MVIEKLEKFFSNGSLWYRTSYTKDIEVHGYDETYEPNGSIGYKGFSLYDIEIGFHLEDLTW